MEGPALAFKVLLVLAIVMAIYRRFEKVHAKFPDFERFIREKPILVAIRSRDAAAIAERLSERCFAGTGERPWPFYELRVAVEVSAGLVVIRARDCELLRVEGEDPPQLVDILREALYGREAEVWLHAALWVDLDHGVRSPNGWRLGEELTPCDEPPAWVAVASPERTAVARDLAAVGR